MLLTFTNIGKDVFPAATQTVLDMSQALGQDLSASSVQLGKALNDPIKGITALSRVGVTFTADQKAMIEKMVAAGDVMGAQKLILAELATEFGGSASAAAQTFSGRMQTIQERIGDVAERLGNALMPHLEGLAAWLSSPEVGAGIDAFATGLINGVSVGFDMVSKAGKWALDNVITPVWNFFSDATVQQTISDIGSALLNGLGKGWEFLVGLGTGIWTTIEDAIQFLGGSSDTGTAIVNIGNALGGALKTGWEWIEKASAGIWSTIEGAIRFLGNSPDTSTAITNIGNAIGGALKTGWDGLMTAGTWAWDNAIKPFFEYLQQPEVKAAILSIAAAVGGLLRDAWLAVEKPAKAAWDAMSKIFGDIKDPKNREEMTKLANAIQTGLAVQFGVLAKVAETLGTMVATASGALTDFFELIEGKGEEFTSFINNLMNLTPAGIVLPDIKTPDQWETEARAGGTKIVNGVVAGFNETWSAVAAAQFITAGEGIPAGLQAGVDKSKPGLIGTITTLATDIITATTATLEEHSPSQVFFRIGEGITAGLGLGITESGDSAKGPLANIISAMQNAARTGLASNVFSPFGAAANAGIAAGIGGGTGAGMAAAGAGAALGGGAVGAASSMAQGVKNAVAGILTSAAFFSVGSAIPAGVANGIAAGASRAIGAASAMARDALKAAKDALGIASPSKEFHIMGEDSAEGYEEGWWSKAPEVAKTTAAVVTMGKDSADKALGTGTTGAYHIMGEDHISDYEDGWWSKSAGLNQSIDEIRHDALGRLSKLPEDDLLAIQAGGGLATDAFKEGVEKGWSSGKGRSLEQILKDANCGAAAEAAKHIDECSEVVGVAHATGTARGMDKSKQLIYDAYDRYATGLIEKQKAHNEHLKAGWDTYAERASDAHHKIARNVLSDLEAMANATTDYLARMESGIVAVGNAVSGVNAYTYGAGNGAESPNSSGSGRRVVPMANGGSGWVNKPTLFLAGEAGREFVSFTPQSTPVLAGGGGGPVVHVYIDGVPVTPRQVRALAEAVGTQHRGGTR
jgi:hypothetical protein